MEHVVELISFVDLAPESFNLVIVGQNSDLLLEADNITVSGGPTLAEVILCLMAQSGSFFGIVPEAMDHFFAILGTQDGVLVVQCLWDINDDRDFDPERREFYSHAC
jgi:uncharacterized protein (DUF342 family)